jgi:dihydroneopterin aldolase
MQDSLHISKLAISTKIGVHAWEQRIHQKLFISMDIPLDLRDFDENIANTIDYDAICRTVTEFVESRSFQWIETVANTVANLLKDQFQLTQTITVTVSKPHAIANAEDIFVKVCR